MTMPSDVQHGSVLPRLGFGTWRLSREASTEALGIGHRHSDTAAIYGNKADSSPGG